MRKGLSDSPRKALHDEVETRESTWRALSSCREQDGGEPSSEKGAL